MVFCIYMRWTDGRMDGWTDVLRARKRSSDRMARALVRRTDTALKEQIGS